MDNKLISFYDFCLAGLRKAEPFISWRVTHNPSRYEGFWVKDRPDCCCSTSLEWTYTLPASLLRLPIQQDYSFFFNVLRFFSQKLGTLQSHFRSCTSLIKSKAPLNPRASSNNRVCCDVSFSPFLFPPNFKLSDPSRRFAFALTLNPTKDRLSFWVAPCVAIPATCLKMFSGRRIWEPWRAQQLLTGGILHRSFPLRCGSYLPFCCLSLPSFPSRCAICSPRACYLVG